MPLISRALLVAVLLIPLPVSPAAAAPTEATADPHLGQITLAPNGPERNTLLWVRLQNAEPDVEAQLEVTADFSGAAGFADVGIDTSPPALELDVVNETGPPTPPCRITDGKLLCSWTTGFDGPSSFEIAAPLAVSPKKTAKTGDTAEITLTARVGDGPVTTSSSTIRVGTGVDLAADDYRELKAAPGKPVKITPTVRNAGATEVDGVALVFNGAPQLLGESSYRNCLYGVGLICTFDAKLEAGRTYALSAPLVLKAPADAVPGSVAQMAHEWLTRTEWDEAKWGEYGTAGTGGLLTLEPKVTSQAEPQADVEPENNFSFTTFTVTGRRNPTLAAIGIRRTAATGSTVVLAPGLTNSGPGTLRPDLFRNNGLVITVRLPGNVVDDGSEDCYPGEDEQVLYCPLEQRLGPGQQATFRIDAEVTTDCGAAGQVEVPIRLAAPHSDPEEALPERAKKISSISVVVPGAQCATVALPITGPGALLGAILLAFGIAAVWLSTGRKTPNRSRPQARK